MLEKFFVFDYRFYFRRVYVFGYWLIFLIFIYKNVDDGSIYFIGYWGD